MSDRYEICIPSYHGHDHWHEVDAYDAEDAARIAGQDYNEDGDYALMNDSIFVLVRIIGTEDIILCSASAEPDVHYSGHECRAVTCQQCKRDVRGDIIAGKIHDLYDDRFCSRECYQQHREDYCKEHGLK